MSSRTLLVVTTLSLLAACGAKRGDPQAAANEPRVTERMLPEEGLLLQEVDLDADGRVEIWNTFREREGASRLQVKKQVDLNLDGKVDVVSFFDESGGLYLEEMDSDFDGLFDWSDHYKDGQRVLAEIDTNFDGRPDIFVYYAVAEDGVARVERKERDTDADGRIDTWERYDTAGNVVRTGRDTDGDGKMDERD